MRMLRGPASVQRAASYQAGQSVNKSDGVTFWSRLVRLPDTYTDWPPGGHTH